MIMLPLRAFRMRSVVLLGACVVLSVHTAYAQEAPTAPRTPMGPGSPWASGVGMVPRVGIVPYGVDGSATTYTMAPPHLGGMLPPAMGGGATRAHGPGPDLAVLESNAIDMLRDKKADVVVLSKANANLILQLYRPDQNKWQEYNLAPLTLTLIVCQPCSGTLKFAFNDGTRQREMDVEVPSVVRLFPDASANQWRWDSLKLVVAGTAEEPSQQSQPSQPSQPSQ